MVEFGKCGCVLAKWFCFGKGVVFGKVVELGQKGLYSDKSVCILAKVIVFGQKWLHLGKVVVFGQK